MASYMEMFQDDPLAPLISADAEAPLQQQTKQSPITDVQREPGILESAGKYATEQVITKGVDKGLDIGIEKGAEMLAAKSAAPTASNLASSLAAQGVAPASYMGGTTATGAGVSALTSAGAGAGGMAALGAAVPYIGAGLLAGKAFGLFNEGGKAGPLYANEGAKTKEKEEGFFQGLASSVSDAADYVMGKGRAGEKSKDFLQGYKSEGGLMYADGDKVKPMHKGPIGLLELFTKGVDSLTGYDRENEKPRRLPNRKRNFLINERRNPYTGEYPITEEEYQRIIMEAAPDAKLSTLGERPYAHEEILQKGYYENGGMAGPLSSIRYKSAGGEVVEAKFSSPLGG